MAGLGLHSHYFKKRASLVNSLKEKILEKLKSGIKVRGSALLVVSGGSTPRVLFEELSKCKLDWRLVTILLADERWISAEDANSNESLVRNTLLKNHAAAAKFVSFLDYYPDLKMTESKIALTLGNLPSYDAVILGMGLDGHTASIFPCANIAQLNDALTTQRPALFIDPKNANFLRFTQSITRLRNTRYGAIHIEGAAKKVILDAAKRSLNNPIYPISYFFEESPYEIYFSE